MSRKQSEIDQKADAVAEEAGRQIDRARHEKAERVQRELDERLARQARQRSKQHK